jgi:hypothetical protein
MHVLLAGALSCWVSPAQTEAAATPGKVKRAEEELLLFALNLDRTPLAEAFPAYATASGSYALPLGELCRTLGIGIQVDPAAREAKGFILTEARRFRLDNATAKVEVDGQTLALDRTQVEWHDTDLYVAIPLLQQWLPVTITADPLAATLTLQPREELPIQAEWLRAKRQALLRPGPAEADPFPLITAPYTLWDVPFVNQNLDLAYRPDAQPGTRKLGWNGATYLSGDLLYMSSSIFFTSRPGHLTDNVRATLFRQDPDGRLLGPLGARNLAVGDIFAPSLPIIGALPPGRGLQVGNFPDVMFSGADRYSLRGTLLPGWTVEVYQNDVLVAFQRFREDGLYEFLDLPLRFGVNEFRLAFYGPEGQRLEEFRRLDPSRSQTPAGSFYYQAAGSHNDTWPANYQVNTAYGLHRQLDLRLALSQVPALASAAGEQQRFGMVSLQGYLPWLTGRMDLARDWAGGTATSTTLNTGWRASSLTLQQSWLDGFSSTEFNPVYGPIRARTQGRLNLNLFRTAPLPLQVALDEQRDLLANGGRVLRTSGQLGTHSHGYSVANTLTWERLQGLPSGRNNQQGSLLVSKTFREVSLRGEANYDLDGWRTRMRSLSLQGEAMHFHPWILQGSYQHTLGQGSDQYTINLNRLEGAATISLKASYSNDAKLFLGVGLRVGLGREPRSGRWVTSARPMAAGGAISAMAFLDPDGDGRAKPGTPAMEGVGLLVNGSPRVPASSSQGVVFQPHLSAGSVLSVSVNPGTIEDPFVKPLARGYRILPRPGKTVKLDFPMVATGEITGTAQRMGPEGPQPLAGLRLELLDADGAVVAGGRSGYDGFFDFADLLPGSYTLRVAADEAERLEASLPPPRSFEMTASGTCFDGIPMVLVPLPAAAAPLPVPFLEEPHAAQSPSPASSPAPAARSVARPKGADRRAGRHQAGRSAVRQPGARRGQGRVHPGARRGPHGLRRGEPLRGRRPVGPVRGARAGRCPFFHPSLP